MRRSLPLAAGDTPRARPGHRPRITIQIINERTPNIASERTFGIHDLVDFSTFGTPHRTHQQNWDLAIHGRARIPQQEIRDLIRAALARIADNLGYDAPDVVVW
jgi:hypothetical protein